MKVSQNLLAKMRPPKTGLNESGFGLIEVIIVASIVSIIALGIGTMISDMFAAQQKANHSGSLNTVRARLIATINSTAHWEATVNHADNTASLGCLRDGTADCANNVTGAVNLFEQGPTVVYPSGTATAGYRLDGTNCNSFNAGTPDPTCPFRWTITWTGTCPGGAATCKDPEIAINGAFQYASTATTLGGGFSTVQYSFNIRRGGDAVSNEPIIARHVLTGNGGEAGSCTGVWVKRGLNTLVSGTAVTGVVHDSANARLTLPAGAYNCRVSAPGFKNGANRIRLTRVSGAPFTNILSGVAVASVNGGSATPSIETSFRLNGSVVFEVQHNCSNAPTDDTDGFIGPNSNNYSLGVPVPDPVTTLYTGAGTTFTSIACVRAGS